MLLSLVLAMALWLVTALLTWCWIKLAQAKQIHDQPERRRLHDRFTPRAGGIGIALVMLPVSIVGYSAASHDDANWLVVVAANVLFTTLGFWDDLKPLRAVRKLLLHLVATAAIFLILLFAVQASPVVSIAIALAYLLYVNIWNFMDGSNGMITMQSLLYVVGFLLLGYFSSATHFYAIALAVCCLGFLPFNFPVARVFLGDVGSHVLGASVVGLAFLAFHENQFSVLEILCLFSGIWIDAVLTFIRRYLRGFKVTHPHRSHLYQYAIRSGKSHSVIGFYYAIWTVGVILAIGLARDMPDWGQRISLLAIIVMGIALHQSLRLFVLKSVRKQKTKNSIT